MHKASKEIGLACIALMLSAWMLMLFNEQHPQIPGKKALKNEASNLAAVNLPPRFVDRTIEAGLLHPHLDRAETIEGIHHSWGAGVCVLDYNRDNLPDIFLASGAGSRHFFENPQWWQRDHHNRLYTNLGGWRFVDHSERLGLALRTAGMGCLSLDANNDGWMDLLLLNRGVNHLYLNNGTDGFRTILLPHAERFAGTAWHTGAAATDLNADGFPDIYISRLVDFAPDTRSFESTSGQQDQRMNFRVANFNSQANSLLMSKGPGQYDDLAMQLNIADQAGRGLSVHWFDLNDDDLDDLIVGNASGSANRVFLRDGAVSFYDAGNTLGLGGRTNTARWLQLPQQADAVLLSLSHHTEPPIAYTRTQQWDKTHWQDKSNALGFAAPDMSGLIAWDGLSADFNNDGFEDILLIHGGITPDQDAPQMSQGQFNRLVLGGPDGWHHGCGASACGDLERDALSSRSAAVADFDQDGDLDLIVAQNNDLPQLLENLGSENQAQQLNHAASRIRLQNPLSRLKITQWLLEQGAEELALQELRRLFDHADMQVREKTIELIAKHKNPLGLDLLIAALRDPQTTINVRAIHALTLLEYEYATRYLLRALSSPLAELSCAAAESFEHFFREEEAVFASKNLAISALIQQLQNPKPEVRRCAANALAESEHLRAAVPLAKAQAIEVDLPTRSAMIQAMGLIRDTRINPTLRQAFSSADSPAMIRLSALQALQRVADEDLTKLFIEATQAEYARGKLVAWLDEIQRGRAQENLHLAAAVTADALQQWWRQSPNKVQILANLPKHLHGMLTPQREPSPAQVSLTNLLRTLSNQTLHEGQRTAAGTALRSRFSERKWMKQCREFSRDNDQTLKALLIRELSACLTPNNKMAKMPALIEWGLRQSDLDLRIRTAELIQPLSASWARTSLLQVAGNKQQPTALRASILKGFMDKPLPSQLELARDLLQSQEIALWYECAKILLKAGSSADRQWLQHILLDNNHSEADRLKLAQAFYEHEPKDLLAMLVQMTLPEPS